MRISIAFASALAGALFLSGCASKPQATIIPAPAPPPVALVKPPPAVLPTGTGNLATIWQLRIALNVAALVCRGPGANALVAGYNGMLTTRRDLLASAEAALAANYGGSVKNAAFDAAMTRLYNFYAQPGATPVFCATAGRIQRAEPDIDTERFADFATRSLVDLNAPFAALPPPPHRAAVAAVPKPAAKPAAKRVARRRKR